MSERAWKWIKRLVIAGVAAVAVYIVAWFIFWSLVAWVAMD
jgi:Tfp pilus assembly protein PilO